MAAPYANKSQLIGAACLFGAVAIIGALAAYAAVLDFAHARASGRWPQTDGVILSAPRGDENALRYAYIVDGRSYEGSRLAFLTRGRIGSPPPRTPGARIRVYVSPTDPATAVLVPGGSGRRFAIWLALGGAVVFVGVAGLTRAMMAFDFPEFDARARFFGKSTTDDSDEDETEDDQGAPASARLVGDPFA